LEHFVKRNWDNLKKLNLSVNHFGPKGAEALSKGSFASLIRLQIYDCGLGDEGVKNLMKNEWPNVQELHLCKYLLNQQIMELAMTESAILFKESGAILISCT
jgi:Ran GTPase-activating protein (RanGAP) involved in mRNA processing and transport